VHLRRPGRAQADLHGAVVIGSQHHRTPGRKPLQHRRMGMAMAIAVAHLQDRKGGSYRSQQGGSRGLATTLLRHDEHVRLQSLSPARAGDARGTRQQGFGRCRQVPC
jgi:hypothetical protein